MPKHAYLVSFLMATVADYSLCLAPSVTAVSTLFQSLFPTNFSFFSATISQKPPSDDYLAIWGDGDNLGGMGDGVEGY